MIWMDKTWPFHASATTKEKTLVKKLKLLTDMNYMRYTNTYNLINSDKYCVECSPKEWVQRHGT